MYRILIVEGFEGQKVGMTNDEIKHSINSQMLLMLFYQF